MTTRRLSSRSERRGFALIAILWLVTALAVLGLDDSAVAREAVNTSANRISAVQARWRVEGCANAVLAASNDALGDSATSPTATWDSLDAVVTAPGILPTGCMATATAAGSRLDVNTADGDALRAVLIAAGVANERADSLADALLDWRDADSIPRLNGAEAAWYRAHGRVVPSNRLFESTYEISLVRGFEAADTIVALLGVEPGRVVLDRAPLPVIAALPGFTDEAVARIAELRWRHESVNDVARLAEKLSDDARRTLSSAYPMLVQRIAAEPDAWIITITASMGTPPITQLHELRLVRAGRRAGVTRERAWP